MGHWDGEQTSHRYSNYVLDSHDNKTRKNYFIISMPYLV